MATEIQLYQRRGLPPSSGPMVKPPMELANQSGQINFGRVITNMAGGLLEKIIDSQVATDDSNGQLVMHQNFQAYRKWQDENPDKMADEAKNGTQFKLMFGDTAKNQILNSAQTPEGKERLKLQWNNGLKVYGGYAQDHAMNLAARQQQEEFEAGLDLLSLQATRDAEQKAMDSIGVREKRGFITPKKAELLRRKFYATTSKVKSEMAQSFYEQSILGIAAQPISEGGGYEAALKAADDPKITLEMSKRGVSLTEQEQIRNVVKARLAEVQRVGTENEKKKLNGLLVDTNMPPNDIYDQIKATQFLNADEQRQYNEWFQTKIELAKNPKPIKTPTDVWSKFDDRVRAYYDGKENRDTLIADMNQMAYGKNPIMSDVDYREFKKQIDNPLPPEVAKYYDIAISNMYKSLVGDPGLLGTKAGEEENYIKARTALFQEVMTGKIKGNEILSRGEELTKQYERTPEEKAIDNFKKMQEEDEAIKAVKEHMKGQKKGQKSIVEKGRDILRGK